MLLLLAVGAKAATVTVTYHIITLPYDNPETTGTVETYRVESVRCTATGDGTVTIGLPDAFKSPLATNYKYWNTSSVSAKVANVKVHSPNNCTYTNYGTCSFAGDGDYTEGSSTVTVNTDVYVTYDYDATEAASRNILLNGTKEYNIGLGNRMMAYNFNRNDRPAAQSTSDFSADYLVSSESNGGYYYLWSLKGSDPYNIVVASTYSGTDTNKHNSEIFSRFGYNMWLTDPTKKLSNGDMQQGLYTSWVLVERNGGYAFMTANMAESGSKAPNNSGQYQYLMMNGGRDPQAQYQDDGKADAVTFYEVKNYTYKVKTPISNTELTATVKWSTYSSSTAVLSKVPDALKRKYAIISGAYKENTFSNTLTTFADADANSNVIWLSYTSEMPFEALPPGDSYTDARWYTMRMNNEDQYIVNYNGTNFVTGLGSNSSLHQGENSAEAQVAFIGDPYELKILSRKASEDNAANRYIGCASDATKDATAFSAKTGSSDISSWEIVNDAISGSMILREMGTFASPKYIGWNYGTSGNPIYYKTAGSRIKVMELEKKNYVYHIINGTGNVAVKMTEAQDVGQPLRLSSIPSLIRSPFLSLLSSSDISYYWSKTDADAGTNAKTHASYDPDTESYDVYVKYNSSAMATALSSSRVHFHTDQYFNVRLNGQYLYYNSGNINTKETITDAEAGQEAYQWRLEGQDPYNMKVYNTGAAAYVKTSFANEASLSFDVVGNASSFLALSGTVENTFEVMAATGDATDVAENYFHIGRSADNTVEMYNKATFPHGYSQIRFVLTLTDAKAYIYHLVDISGTDLLQVRSRFESLYFPIEYRSPLVSTYHYYATLATARTRTSEIANLDAATETVDGLKQIYVTYDVNSLVNLQRGQLYLLKYQAGENFRQEDGVDNLLPSGDMAANTYRYKAVYPYCNGDCNFFVYGEEQYDIQQQGAASTRTRWAWYVESTNNDPYHVKICSRQTETFNSTENRGYFRTYTETYGDTKHVVTTLAWPGITGVQGSEYMVLGSVGQYQLVTTQTVPIDLNDDGDYDDSGESNERQVVSSFEQYWKTFDTIRKKIFGNNVANNATSLSEPTTVPATPLFDVAGNAGKTSNRDYLTDVMGFHYYTQWAYAKRWNGFNISNATSKGWELIEHWYQTVDMGEGYFDFVATSIDPVLILLDQHGWEIMRKPLPTDPDDPSKATKYEAIRAYNSPMVKEYYFWGGAKKRSGFHQYYDLSSRITNNGENYASTDLTTLPPYATAVNIKDKKGNLLDQYVTYVAKDEYAQSYTYDEESETWVGTKFLIQQGDKYFSASDASTIANTSVPAGGMSKAIIDANGTFADNILWYVKPNADIDTEMGYDGYAHNWTNAYTGSTSTSGFNSNGFDPYNIQISNAQYTTSFLVTNATTGHLDGDGGMEGDASTVSLGSKASTTGSWHDSRALAMTNATFMAVQDDAGNMQLMPRFDHAKRVRNFASLVTPVAEAGDATKLPQTHTLLFRPVVYNYHVVDNSGQESVHFKSGGDLVPELRSWYKSPLAKNFTYYKTLTLSSNSGRGTYDLATLADPITASFAAAGMTASSNDVYVRYEYDEEADVLGILKGKWLTMKMNSQDMQGVVVSAKAGTYYDKYDSSVKPGTVDADDGKWQWKFLATPQTEPDPYAVCFYNRALGGQVGTDSYALLSHNYTGGGYIFALNDKLDDYTPKALQAKEYNSSNWAKAASNSSENGLSTGAAYDAKSQVLLYDDVKHTYNYKVYTNGTNGENDVKYGVLAVSATQDQAVAESNEFVPVLPDAAQTPLLNLDQYLYYGSEADMGNSAKELENLYGLYDDEVFVRYVAYDPLVSTYMVPNDKTLIDSHVARGTGSNDTPLSLNGSLLYNIIWYNDNMMRSNGSAIEGTADQSLQAESAYEWKLTGDDPYAIKITNMSEKNVYTSDDATCSLSDENATTFMLLNRDGYEYGVLAKTGDATKMLSGYGNIITTSDTTEFIIFALSTYKVIYHLVLAKSCNNHASPGAGEYVDIPYYDTEPATPVLTTKRIYGTTQRDLSSTSSAIAGETYQLGETINGQIYSFDAGHISLGDELEVPSVFYRPNVAYSFFVEGVYTNPDCAEGHANNTMNNLYKGRELTQMGDNSGLLGQTVRINIVYSFNGDLTTNAGSGFVTSPGGTQWYTFETNDPTPFLARYAYSDTRLTAKEGRATHYTNDYLWSPLGDPYGFRMYNRYVYKNGNETTNVMTTEAAPAADNAIVMSIDATDKSIYELLEGVTPGFFKVHPLTGAANLYLDNNEGVLTLKTNSTTEWTYGLSESLLSPYYTTAGYVGGLNSTGVAAYNAASTLIEKQAVVYNDVNIVPYSAGYYRLHSQPGAAGILTVRYASGYTHEIEKTAGAGSTAIPMHFYETQGASTIFENLSSGGTLNKGFTETAATRGELPIPAVEYDPASIFYFTGTSPTVNIQTQGLKVNGAAMHASTATNFKVEDIGGACVVIHDATATPSSRLYLNYDQSDADHIYDLHYSTGELSDHSKWCMQPAEKLGLRITTHSGGDGELYGTNYYYSSLYVPFDIMLPDPAKAYACNTTDSPWGTELHPKPVGTTGYNTGTYAGNDKFVPAGSPVLIATTDATGYVNATLPTSSPSTSIANNTLTGTYLEQKLDAGGDVYTFGLPLNGTISKADDYASTGNVDATLPSQASTGRGFYLNANPNKEAGPSRGNWTRNNWYVYSNKIYYRATSSPAKPDLTRSIDFIPVRFDDDDAEPISEKEDWMPESGDNRIYDLQGRCVATADEVEDGSWRHRLSPGIYVINGKKFCKK